MRHTYCALCVGAGGTATDPKPAPMPGQDRTEAGPGPTDAAPAIHATDNQGAPPSSAHGTPGGASCMGGSEEGDKTQDILMDATMVRQDSGCFKSLCCGGIGDCYVQRGHCSQPVVQVVKYSRGCVFAASQPQCLPCYRFQIKYPPLVLWCVQRGNVMLKNSARSVSTEDSTSGGQQGGSDKVSTDQYQYQISISIRTPVSTCEHEHL